MNTCLDVDVSMEVCTHGRFEVLFGIGGVALVGDYIMLTCSEKLRHGVMPIWF